MSVFLVEKEVKAETGLEIMEAVARVVVELKLGDKTEASMKPVVQATIAIEKSDKKNC